MTHIYAKKNRMRTDSLCTFCNEHEETITHLLFQCEIVSKVLEDVHNLFDEIVPFVNIVPLRLEQIISNIVNDASINVINFLVLVTKYYIYKCRCYGNTLNIADLKREILKLRNMEKYDAVKKGKLAKHLKKW